MDALRALQIVGTGDEVLRPVINFCLVKDFDLKGGPLPKPLPAHNCRLFNQLSGSETGAPRRDSSRKVDLMDALRATSESVTARYSPLDFQSQIGRVESDPHLEKVWRIAIAKFSANLFMLPGHRFRKSGMGRINLRQTFKFAPCVLLFPYHIECR